jgi:hypothetical protein
VYIPIYLNHSQSFRTVEIYDVRAHSVLTAKFKTEKLFGSKSGPQSSFRSCHLRTK